MLDQIFQGLRIAEVLDVALVAAVLFVLLQWLHRSMSRHAVVALFLLIAAYVAVRLLQLYLMEMLFRGFLVVLLIAGVVVFQADLRRMVERIGMWAVGRTDPAPGSSPAVDVLTEAVEHMASSKTGALIALQGRESWDRLIDGGIDLNGRVSLPLLYSLFSPMTPGHDGAVLMEGDRIARFGAHLPLSTNLVEVGDHGTRHTAALGLAERCDALVIVVSEERGTISIAERGQLICIGAPGDLKQRIEAFWIDRHVARSRDGRRTWLTRSTLLTLFVSVGLAILSWYLFIFDANSVYRTLLVPIELRNLPAEWALEDPVPVEARLTLSGTGAGFRLLDLSRLVVSLNLADVSEGTNEFVITADNLSLPSGMRLYRVEPREVEIEAFRLHSVDVPVAVRTTGALPDSLEVVAISATPATVRILAPRDESPDVIATEPIDLGRIKETTTLRVALVPSEEIRFPTGQRETVGVEVQVRRKSQALQP